MIYDFLNWLDLQQPLIECFGGIVLAVTAFMVAIIMLWPEKRLTEKWSKSATSNLLEGIRKHG